MRLPPKKSEPRRGKRERLPDQPSASFVTLQLGRNGISRVLSQSNESLVRWLVECAISNTQTSNYVALDTRQRHEKEGTAQVGNATEQAHDQARVRAQAGASVSRLAARSSSGRCGQQPLRVSQHRLIPLLPSVCAGRYQASMYHRYHGPSSETKVKAVTRESRC